MKRVLVLLFGVLCLIGCEKNEYVIDHPVSGKIYYNWGGLEPGSVSVFLYFYPNGKFSYEYINSNPDETLYEYRDNNYTWRVEGEGSRISIYYAKNYIDPSKRETLYKTYRYESLWLLLYDENDIPYRYWRDVF